jgi:hypothetical protein
MGQCKPRLPWYLSVAMLAAGCEAFDATNTTTGPPPTEIASRKPMTKVAACLAEKWGSAFPNLIVAPAGKGLRVSVSARENSILFEAQIQPDGSGSRIIFANLASTNEPLVGQAVRDAKLCARSP